jgi:hypothetical protein
MHDFEVTSPLKPKRLKISSSDKALEVIEDDGKLSILEATSREDEEDVDSGHLKSNPHDPSMKLDSIDPPFEFCHHPLVLMQATNLIEVEQFTPPLQVCVSMILVQTTSNTTLSNINICI